jgi:hypothetical protein
MKNINELTDKRSDLEKLEELHRMLQQSHKDFNTWLNHVKVSPELLQIINDKYIYCGDIHAEI